MINVNEAKRIVLDNIQPLGTVKVPLLDAIGYVLSEDIKANCNLPPFDNSAMDGYALRSYDTAIASGDNPARFIVIGESVAGNPFGGKLKRHRAVKIMTGAVLPKGADCVVMQEEIIQDGNFINVQRQITRGEHIRRRGEDIKKGRAALKKLTLLGAQHLGLLSALGVRDVNVYRSPDISVIATGSELVSAGKRLARGSIRNSNTPVLLGLLKKAGINAQDLGIVKDNLRDLASIIKKSIASSDLIIICGGVSVGKYDLVKDVLYKQGFKTLFWKVNMKPGKPLLFGKLDKKIVFGLPGNPVSCAVCFIEFVLPAIRKMMAKKPYFNKCASAILKKPLTKKDRRSHYITAFIEETPKGVFVSPTTTQGSGMLTSLAGANSFIVLDEDTTSVIKGANVEALLL